MQVVRLTYYMRLPQCCLQPRLKSDRRSPLIIRVSTGLSSATGTPLNAHTATLVMRSMESWFGALPLLAVFLQAQPHQQQPQLVWEGKVDGTSVLHIRGKRLDIEDKQGAPVGRERHRFFDSLPETRQDAQMEIGQSRGRVRIMQQPRPDNNYTLSVEIEDQPGGRSMYSLAFFWRTADRRSPSAWLDAPVNRPSQRSLQRGEERVVWSGRVDDEAVIECRGRECRTQQVRGGQVERDRFTFTEALPNREFRVSLDNVQGRGETQLIEQPSSSNGYAAKVRIRDHQGGAGDYAFSLYWTAPRASEPERLFGRAGAWWSGRVDGTVRVWLNGTSGGSDVVAGGPVTDERVRFDRPVPNGSAPNLAVRKIRGRGRVEIVEFPSARNNGRVVVEITDSSGGADAYEIEIGW